MSRSFAENARVGRLKKAVGDAFESWVEGQHQSAMYLGMVAHVAHNFPPSKMVGGRVIYSEAGVADYTGTLEGGRSLAVEAKSTSHTRLQRSVISPKQQQHMALVARAGGLALLLVEFRSDEAPLYRRVAIPWLEVPWKRLRTAESIGFDDVRNYEVPPGSVYLIKWHGGGPRSSPDIVTFHTYARE